MAAIAARAKPMRRNRVFGRLPWALLSGQTVGMVRRPVSGDRGPNVLPLPKRVMEIYMYTLVSIHGSAILFEIKSGGTI